MSTTSELETTAPKVSLEQEDGLCFHHNIPQPPRRLHGSLGMVSPDEFEAAYYAALDREPKPAK